MLKILIPVSLEEFDRAFNESPSIPVFNENFRLQDFDTEYSDVQQCVINSLSTIGTHDIAGNGDFTMNDDAPLARSLGVTLTSKKMCRLELIKIVQRDFKKVQSEYRMYVDHALIDEPDFYILIYPNKAIGHFAEKHMLDYFEE